LRRGIKGEAIRIEARILAVADAIEDLTVHHSYRNSLPLDKALEEVSSRSGSKYDPDVVDTCLRLFREKGYSFG
jgi:HD-GYP domain-containing protein (c-di-GMP phosphodiesterase class II)